MAAASKQNWEFRTGSLEMEPIAKAEKWNNPKESKIRKHNWKKSDKNEKVKIMKTNYMNDFQIIENFLIFQFFFQHCLFSHNLNPIICYYCFHFLYLYLHFKIRLYIFISSCLFMQYFCFLITCFTFLNSPFSPHISPFSLSFPRVTGCFWAVIASTSFL